MVGYACNAAGLTTSLSLDGGERDAGTGCAGCPIGYSGFDVSADGSVVVGVARDAGVFFSSAGRVGGLEALTRRGRA